MNKITIAIDGYSSCGKSTLAKTLAKRIDYSYVDTGAMYRCVTLYAIENGIIKNDQVDKESLVGQLDDISISFQNSEQSKNTRPRSSLIEEGKKANTQTKKQSEFNLSKLNPIWLLLGDLDESPVETESNGPFPGFPLVWDGLSHTPE